MVRPLTGPLKGVAEGYMETVQATLEQINAQGGVSGQKLSLLALDDVGDPAQTAAQAKVLAGNPAVLAVLGIAGTGNVLAAAPALSEAKLALVGPFSGAAALRTPSFRHIYHVRASYDDELDALVDTMAARYPRGRAVVLYQDDPFGAGAYGTFLKAASGRAPFLAISAFKFDRATGDLLDVAGAQSAAKGADAVLVVAAPKSAAKQLAMVRAQSRTATVYMLSVVDALALVREVGATTAAGVLITQVFPNPKKSNTKLARDYRAAIEKAGLPLSYAGLEGHVATRLLVEALGRIKGAPTREKVIAALDDLGRIDLGGFPLNLAKGNRAGSRFVDLSLISPSGSVID
jgi:ABC-type branched-subunit amino acid transport system substrate-binding protein